MTVAGIAGGGEPPLSEEVRQRGIEMLQGLLANGSVDLDRFHLALDALLKTQNETELAGVVRSLPPPVPMTPSARRRQEPLEISTSMGEVRLEGRWQVGRQTTIHAGMATVTIDLTDAEFDDWDVEIAVHATMGEIMLIVPRGFDVRQVGRNSGIIGTLEPPIPGFPVVRLRATADMGRIRVMHPKQQKQRRRRWRRRGQRVLPG